MKLGWEWPKNIEFIGAITKDILAGVASPLSNITAGVFANGLTKAIEKINTERTRKEIFKKAKEKAKEKLPALKDKFEKLTPKDLPPTFLRFKDEEVFCSENPALCEKITQEGCKLFYRIIQEEFSRYAHRSDEFWKEFITQLRQDQSREIEEVRKEIEKRGIKQEDFWRKLFDRYFEKLLENIRPRHIITYFPPVSPDVADFVNRNDEQINLEDLIRRKKHMIIIQGIAGIGKTQIAAKLMENIKNDYRTYWKEMRDVDTFDRVIKDSTGLAGFLRNNNDSELADYIEDGGTDHETIFNILLSSLKEKQYVLFFDNYQMVEDKEVHDIFKRFKDKLTNSTIIITTREPPQFVNPVVDEIENKVKEENVEGFDSDGTREYLEQKGVEVSEEQLVKIGQKIGGHPYSLRLFASLSLSGEMEIDKIIENMPETKVLDWLYYECYDKLIRDGQEVLEALSVFRTAVTADACIQVSKTANVKKILMSLIRKLLAERKRNLYYLHDSIRELSYNKIDNPKEYHRRAGEYYALLDKTPENILETTYHMIKATGSVTDEVVKYLIGTPQDPDPFTSFTVLDILKENEITSPLIFELLNEFTTNPDLTIQKMFIIEYGNFFGKILRINHEKSVDVLRQILGQANPTLLTMLSRSVAKLAYEFPADACELWKNIIERGDREVRLYVSYDILDSNLDAKEAAPILEKIIEKSEESADFWYAKTALKNWGVLETQEMAFEDHLEKLRKMSIDEKLLYIKQIKGKVEGDFAIEILDKVYLQDPDKVAEVLKLLVKSYYSHPTTMQRIPRIIAKLAKEDINYLKVFLMEHENNEYIKFVGLRGLDMIKNEIAGENIYALLTPMLADNNPVIRELASILSEEIKTSPTVTERNKEKRLIDPKSILGKLNPRYIIKILETDLSTTEPLAFLMSCWALQKAVEGTDPEIILRILKPLNKYDNTALRNIWRLVATTTQKHPSTVLWVANFALKLNVQVKMSAIWVICNVGNLAPQKAIKKLEPLKNMDNPLLCIHLLACLKDLRDTLPDETKTFFKELSNHPDGNVRGLAKLLLNGV